MEIRLNSSHLHVALDLNRGAEFTHFGPDKHIDVLAYYDWDSPLPASRSLSYGNERQDWLSSYRGGWQELFPNAGLGCTVDGVPLPFHGEVSLARWDLIERGPTSLTVRCPSRLPLVIERRVRLLEDSATMQLEEVVKNVSDRTVDFLWGHHPAYDSPAGTVIDLPEGVSYEIGEASDSGRTAVIAGDSGSWPWAKSPSGEAIDLSTVPTGTVSRVCYLRGGSGWYAVRPPEAPGVALAWDQETFPTMWLWQQIGGERFPTYGRARITAIEPNSASPGDGLAAAVDRGDALAVEAGGSRETWVTATLLQAGCPPVAGVGRSGDVAWQSAS